MWVKNKSHDRRKSSASASGIQLMFAQMLDHSLVNFILSQTHSHHLLPASHDANAAWSKGHFCVLMFLEFSSCSQKFHDTSKSVGTLTSTVIEPMIARWWPSKVSKATCWICSSVLLKNCSQAANSISSFCPWILT